MLSNNLFVDLLEAVHATLLSAGYQMLIGVTHYDRAEEEQLLHRPAGLVLSGFDHSPATRALIAQSGVPRVYVMEIANEPDVYSVGFSQREAAAALTRHLLERGRRRIAFGAAQLDPRTLQRLDGWREEMRSQGLHDAKLEWMNPSASSMALGAQMFEQIMAHRPAVDAIFFCNDDLAQGALLAALRLGVRVPAQVAVAGFNDLTGSEEMVPPLTTVRTRRGEIGDAAARMLLALMQRDQPRQRTIDVGFEVVVRGST
jgi:LacI family gluconate utilization system Gnt-I transcriptional repressor